MPLQKKDELRIRKNFKDLVQDLQITKILDSLVSADVLSLEDTERITAKPVQSDQNRQLLFALIRGKREGYAEFIKCLREDDAYGYLADKIENTQIDDKDTVEETFGLYIVLNLCIKDMTNMNRLLLIDYTHQDVDVEMDMRDHVKMTNDNLFI